MQNTEPSRHFGQLQCPNCDSHANPLAISRARNADDVIEITYRCESCNEVYIGGRPAIKRPLPEDRSRAVPPSIRRSLFRR